MTVSNTFLYMTRPPMGALPYCRFWQVVKPDGMTERDSVDRAVQQDPASPRLWPAERGRQ